MQTHKTVEAYTDSLDPEKKQQVLMLMSTISAAEPGLEEHIKWNAPSYMHNGEDRITFNLINKQGLVKLVFHMGVKRQETKGGKPVLNDPYGIVEWASDIRGYITFANIEDVRVKQKAVADLVLMWVSIK